MPRSAQPVPAGLLRAPFTIGAAAAAGVAADALRRADLRIPTPGVRAAGPAPAPDDLHARCRELLPALPEGAVFCDVTALTLLGVDLPWGTDPRSGLHVQVGPGVSWPRRAGVVPHQRSAPTVRAFILPGGLPVMLPELVWTQLAGKLDTRELVVLADALMRRRDAHCIPQQLAAAVDALTPGTRGVRRLRAAVARARPRTDSCMESRLRWIVVDAGLPCPEVNSVVRDREGRVVAMPDLSYPERRIAIEYDGDVHRTDARTWRRDITRRQQLEAMGWRMITCTADDVLRTPDRTISWIRSALVR